MEFPPGPRGLRTLGFADRRSGPLAYLTRTSRRYGPVAGFRLFGLRVCIVDEPSLIEDILVRRQHEFVRDTGATMLRELVGDALLTSEEPLHRRRRRIMQPAFGRAHAAAYAAAIVERTVRLARQWEGARRIDVAAEMRRLTLGIVGAALFGAELDDRAAAIAAVLDRVARRMLPLAPFLGAAEPVVRALRRRFPRAPSLLFARERRELDALVAPLVARRRDAGERDILSLLTRARDDDGHGLDERAIRDEIITLILAGHETTATALTWAWYLLATHPAVAATLQAELDAVLGDRDPTPDDLPHLPYTAAVVRETLRLYPPAAAFGRRPIADITLGGYRIPRGTSVFVSPYVTGRNPRWFARPDDFVPERWLEPPPPRFAYFPFGGGAKVCIGEPLAMLETQLVVATLGRRFALRLADDAPVGIAPGPTLRPAGAIIVDPLDRRGVGYQPSSSG